MHPRFTIHSWNDDCTVNEPWMYPGVTPAIPSDDLSVERYSPDFIARPAGPHKMHPVG